MRGLAIDDAGICYIKTDALQKDMYAFEWEKWYIRNESKISLLSNLGLKKSVLRSSSVIGLGSP